ncbi:unnamed protein product, partial [Prorocentrum cordatum]
DWACKSCISKRGRAVVNWGTALKCQARRLPKHACFGANVPLPQPGEAAKQPAAASGKDDAALAAEVKECELGLQAPKDVTAGWAKAPRDELRARTHAIANKAKQCADRLDKADGAMRKAKEALQRAREKVPRTEQVHAELLAQQAALQAELATLQQQAPQVPPPRAAGQAMTLDVIGGLGIVVGELEAIMRVQLAEHPDDEQPAEAQKRAAGVLGERVAELYATQRARRAGPAAEAAAGEESLEQLEQHLSKVGLEHEGGEEAVRTRCAALARGDFSLIKAPLVLSAWFPTMAKGSIAAMSAAAGGSLAPCVEGLGQHSDVVVLAVQGHRAKDHDGLATLQHAMLDHGYAGVWAAAAAGARGGDTTSGVVAARLVAARLHWGVAGGLVAVAAYLRDNVGWSVENQRLGMILVCYLARLNAAGLDLVAGGDFNMSAGTLPVQL